MPHAEDSESQLDREPTEEEAAVLACIVGSDPALAAEFAGAAPRVVGVCGCGCPSIWFEHSTDPALGVEIAAEASVDGDDLQTVLLFVTEDRQLAALELMWMTDEPPGSFPAPDLLRVSVP